MNLSTVELSICNMDVMQTRRTLQRIYPNYSISWPYISPLFGDQIVEISCPVFHRRIVSLTDSEWTRRIECPLCREFAVCVRRPGNADHPICIDQSSDVVSESADVDADVCADVDLDLNIPIYAPDLSDETLTDTFETPTGSPELPDNLCDSPCEISPEVSGASEVLTRSPDRPKSRMRYRDVCNFCAEHGIKVPSNTSGIPWTHSRVWECTEGHKFTASFATIRRRIETGRKKPACIICEICEHAKENNLVVAWPISGRVDSQTVINWICLKCDKSTKMGLREMFVCRCDAKSRKAEREKRLRNNIINGELTLAITQNSFGDAYLTPK